ncbi:3-hydroxyacyl-CoA dehydrogenase, NAD binding domain [Purpureocillium lilacinum]|uniref:3-hydroxyacyl-CoA dehydrogenase, NAD binding domain n=1 Tax=Purpureocillium lilacinum TaxID=33203 RepID=A0A179GDE6_PURLI|nr:3-hydroxyacyl-CoA dehydrogenase, NAD binding domain [Purpureocillium lilacinum]GJN76132.1 hypothetical protein PLICBS_010244 [Purpureocillium lilacinum]
MTAFTLPSTHGRVVTVLGGGVLGRRIACAWAASGFDVTIRDPSAEQRIAAKHYCDTSMPQYSDSSRRGTVRAVEDMAASVSDAWLVIEAVPEKLPLKISTFAELETLAPGDAILCSNSSSLKSRDMVGGLRPQTRRRVLNMHYYMPPGNRIVELMTDGETDERIFPFLVERLREIGMHPFVARKESTGLIFNRLWAAIKREVLNILAEEVSTPEEVERMWKEMYVNNHSGPVAMMDAVGLDTVSFIEQHYIDERGLPDAPVKFLQSYIDAGKLGAKSPKGGLLPPGGTTRAVNGSHGDHDNVHSPLLYLLDIGLSTKNPQDAFRAGRVLVGSQDARPLKALVSNQHTPDGIDISLSAGKLFWTSMGIPSQNDGAVYSSNLDGSDVTAIVPRGAVHTPKQLTVDSINSKLYFSDREGLRVMRCAFDGSGLEVLVQTGDWRDESHQADQTRWCVGVTVSPATGKFYWTQKGPSKGGKGRIFRADMVFRAGETAASRSDVELLFQNLPEPIDLEVDEAENMLYWTDRGELPLGNSINRAKLETVHPAEAPSRPGKDYEVIARDMHEAIGIKLDPTNRHIYTTDLGGTVYRLNLDGGDRKKLYEGSGAIAGITLAYV